MDRQIKVILNHRHRKIHIYIKTKKNYSERNMKTMSSIIITISLLLAMTMCTLQVNAYHRGRDLRPVKLNSKVLKTKLMDSTTNWNKCIKSVACNVNSKKRSKAAMPLPKMLPNHIWMFSFGANVGSKVFQTTNVAVKHSVPAILSNHCLKFNSRVGDKVNVFANVIPSKPNRKGFKAKLLKKIQYGRVGQKKRCVHGVIHMISKSDLENIFDKREQCHIRKQVTVKSYNGENVKNVEVYYANNGKQYNKPFTLKPETRYLKLIYCGVKERHLNKKYVNEMKKLLLKSWSKNDDNNKKKIEKEDDEDEILDCTKLNVLKTPPTTDKNNKNVKCLWG